MSVDEFSRRVDQVIADFQASEDRKRYDAFEQLAQLVDRGELEWETVYAICQELGAVALLASIPVNPAIQALALRKLDEAGDA
jgi:hypothetical protein